jgi:hypothetical protein
MKDVMNLNNNLQSWHNNYNWKTIHTQATRMSNSEFNGYGAYGGLDDRFDFITVSENIVATSDINYVQNSYKSYGNNGNCYNKRIDDSSCTGSFDFTLRSNLYLMSDHLPVVAELQSQNTLTLQDNYFENLLELTNGNLITNSLSLNVNPKLKNHSISIYNSIGQKIYSQKIKSDNITIATSNLKSGIYYIKVQNYPNIIKFVKK